MVTIKQIHRQLLTKISSHTLLSFKYTNMIEALASLIDYGNNNSISIHFEGFTKQLYLISLVFKIDDI